jgi:hypothetical protein
MHGVGIQKISCVVTTLYLLIFRYSLQFHAVKGIKGSYMSLDDLSMSPECFGFGMLRYIVFVPLVELFE